MASLNPKYQINLNQAFNKAFADQPSSVRDALRDTLAGPAFRSTFGKMVIDRIIERTLSGIDKNSVKFASYSRSYINSDIFKIYQKSPGEVNLELTGEMLSSLTDANSSRSVITVELVGSENKAKAAGHKYGIRKRGGGRVIRDFLGLPDSDVTELMRDAMSVARNDAFQASAEFFRNTSFVEVFGQVGNQPEFDATIFTPEVLQLLAQRL